MKFQEISQIEEFLNEAVRVYTGSKLPVNTRTVIIQENTKVINNNFILLKNNIKKENI